MAAKSQQNFYNTVTTVVISSKDCLFSIHFQDLVKKNHEMAHTNQLLPVKIVYSLSSVEKQLGIF